MSASKPYLQHLTRSDDLITTYEETRAGFVTLILERNHSATPFVEQARALKAAASTATKPADLLDIRSIRAAVLTAAGASDKAAGYVKEDDKTNAIQELIENFLEPAGPAFVEELVFRFLLTRGDSLGGIIRNLAGELAQRKLTRAVFASLVVAGTSCYWLDPNDQKTWRRMTEEDAATDVGTKGLAWPSAERFRTMVFNRRVPLVDQNVDICLLACDPRNLSRKELAGILRTPARYIALGELKGGIDPGGADEHWKTARSALVRIRSRFQGQDLFPVTFYAGGAIEKKMAGELWDQLEGGHLNNAANLTDHNQFSSLCNWLSSL